MNAAEQLLQLPPIKVSAISDRATRLILGLAAAKNISVEQATITLLDRAATQPQPTEQPAPAKAA